MADDNPNKREWTWRYGFRKPPKKEEVVHVNVKKSAGIGSTIVFLIVLFIVVPRITGQMDTDQKMRNKPTISEYSVPRQLKFPPPANTDYPCLT